MIFNKVVLAWCMVSVISLSLLGCGQSNQRKGGPSLHPDYRKAVESAARTLPEAVEMEELFGRGEVDHFIEHFGLGDERWNSEVHFGGRYCLTMQVDIDVDHRQHAVSPKGKPIFYMVEYNRIDILSDGRAHAHSGNPAGLAKHSFSSDQWDLFYKSGGDLAVLGVKENKTPVADFSEHVRQVRRDRKPVISLLPPDGSASGKALAPGGDSKDQ